MELLKESKPARMLKVDAEEKKIVDSFFLITTKPIIYVANTADELDDFQIQTVTEGRDSMGSALVKLRENGKLYSGTGISTDILGASIRAYINALNKIAYEEEA